MLTSENAGHYVDGTAAPRDSAAAVQDKMAQMEQVVIDRMLNHEPPLLRAADVDAFRAILHAHTMLVAREGHRAGWVDALGDIIDQQGTACGRFPLPPRRVLREEPDPHGYGEWRVTGGAVQWRDTARRLPWLFPQDFPANGPVTVEPTITVERCLLVADLHANPYREEPQ